MKIFIVEDEHLAVRKLEKTLQAISDELQVQGTADSISMAVEWLQSNPQPDLILMDIELADGQSFEIFNQVEVKSPVIFTTSYDEFALRAFKVNSVDYLLKPIQKDELEASLEKLKTLRASNHSASTDSIDVRILIKELQQTLQPQKEFRKRFLIKHAQKLISIEIDRIAYFFSEEGLSFIKTMDDKKFIIEYTMDDIQEMTDPSHFFRVNRSFIVSAKSIDMIQDYFGNRLKLNLKPEMDKEVLVSREKVTTFKEWMGK